MPRIEFVRSLYQEQRFPEEDLRQHYHPERGPSHPQSWGLSSRGSEAFRLDSERVMSKFHQKPRDILHQRSGPTDKNFRVLLRWKARLGKQHFVNSSPMAHPSLRLFTGQRVDNA